MADLVDFVAIPSVSAAPAHVADVARAGQWVADRLHRAGITNARVLQTDGHPVVYAEWLGAGPAGPRS